MYYERIDGCNYPTCGYRAVILKRQGLPEEIQSYHFMVDWRKQNNGIYNITQEKIFTIANWCDENLDGDWLIGANSNGFELEDDVVKFKLRWL